MSIRRFTMPILTDGAGAATVYGGPADGTVLMVRVVRGTLASGAADVTITDNDTGAAILTLTNITADADYYPRGAAVTPAAAAITNSFVPIPVTGQVKVVVAQGGAAATGTVYVWVEQCRVG